MRTRPTHSLPSRHSGLADTLPQHRCQTSECEQGQRPCRVGLGAASSHGRQVPWAHTVGNGAGADLCTLTPDYTVQNLTRMGLAALVLLLLGILFCQARHDHGGARDAARS